MPHTPRRHTPRRHAATPPRRHAATRQVPVPKERIGQGLAMGDRVELDAEAEADRPLVTAAYDKRRLGPSAGELGAQALACTCTCMHILYRHKACMPHACVHMHRDMMHMHACTYQQAQHDCYYAVCTPPRVTSRLY